jgi:hypothetical protein
MPSKTMRLHPALKCRRSVEFGITSTGRRDRE